LLFDYIDISHQYVYCFGFNVVVGVPPTTGTVSSRVPATTDNRNSHGRWHTDHLIPTFYPFNINGFYTIPTIVQISNKHQKKYGSMQTIAKTFAVKNIHLCCF
jgi:hypothetical protein